MTQEAENSGAIHPVILCGGSGARLWPLSRESYPKQFVKLFGEAEPSLFQQTLLRMQGPRYAAPVVIANDALRFIAADQITTIGAGCARLIIEPMARNTAPAVLAAALHIEAQHPGATLLVAPCDHLIPDKQAFDATLFAALDQAPEEAMVTFGIKPSYAETGYGYLELGAPAAAGAIHPLARFVEKPDLARAEAFLASGQHLWNAGVFMMKARVAIEAFRRRAVAAKPFSPLGALDRRGGRGGGDGRCGNPADPRKRLGLHPARRGPSPDQPRQASPHPDRGPDRRLSRRGRHRQI